MSEKCDKGLILKVYLDAKKFVEFRNVDITVYENLKKDMASGRPYVELATVVYKDCMHGEEKCNKMHFIPTAKILDLTIEEPSTAEKEGRK